MEEQIRAEILRSEFYDVTLKDSKGSKITGFMSSRSLLFMSASRQRLYKLSPIRFYDHGAIGRNQYVSGNFIYEIEEMIPIVEEEKFLEALRYVPEKHYAFTIRVDDKAVFQSDRSVITNKKLKYLIRTRKVEGSESYNCKKIELQEPENKQTTWLWSK